MLRKKKNKIQKKWKHYLIRIQNQTIKDFLNFKKKKKKLWKLMLMKNVLKDLNQIKDKNGVNKNLNIKKQKKSF